MNIPPPQAFARIRSALMPLCVLATTMASNADLIAQTGPRSNFVFHVYVDPLYGDNARATAQNPNASGTTATPLSEHRLQQLGLPPATILDRDVQGFLQHAPYSFKTLSGPEGALQYIDDTFDVLPKTYNGRTVTNVLVHCLPGLYGSGNSIDQENGLPYNGEELPIVLDRDHIGIQGTSFLDTVFDAQDAPHFFECRTPFPAPSLFLIDTFIDGIQFRRASVSAIRVIGLEFDPNAIVKGELREATCQLEISNCLFRQNECGVSLNTGTVFLIPATANEPAQEARGHRHQVLFVNNTFVDNRIGIWRGDSGSTVEAANLSQMALINNIFDPFRPDDPTAQSSAIEGLDPDHLRIVEIDSNPQAGVDSNARPSDPNLFNRGLTLGSFGPGATATTGPFPAPRVDLNVYQDPTRILFAREAIDADLGVTNYSPHDYRISPMARATSTDVPFQNPLINAGVLPDRTNSSDVAIRMADGLFPAIPSWGTGWRSFADDASEPNRFSGYPETVLPPHDGNGDPGNNNAEEAPICSWDVDGEGFGNTRVHVSDRYDSPTPVLGEGGIDIGADEAGTLIVGGFRDRTRMFTSSYIPNAAPSGDRLRPIFLNRRVPGVLDFEFFPLESRQFGGISIDLVTSSGLRDRPILPWFGHIQTPTDLTDIPGSNYTIGHPDQLPPTGRAPFPLRTRKADSFTTPLNDERYRPHPRNLRSDFSPGLAFDAQPIWADLIHDLEITAGPPERTEGVDYYASNPSFDRLVNFGVGPRTLGGALIDNPALFHNRRITDHDAAFRPFDGSTARFFFETFVDTGHLNPPGTFSPALVGPGGSGLQVAATPATSPGTPTFGGNMLLGNFPSSGPGSRRTPRFTPSNTPGGTTPFGSGAYPMSALGTSIRDQIGTPVDFFVSGLPGDPGIGQRYNLQNEAIVSSSGPGLVDQPTNLQTFLVVITPLPIMTLGQGHCEEAVEAAEEAPTSPELCEAILILNGGGG